ncbi:7-carboxy-7-deazaguanine synthase QueE [Cupriavidus taiwanensis]|uniref:7-carboxy-7-deazaguanine synthase QueE n=1 Tax=Cupriavidus taiwanensis TaxID=164546 RepID=UPI000E11893F|nr:7-carboxy-7-deazaguanine synthase QueE [Cupriavidus taiwanensis]SPA17236.1 7-carboxy-7-deazaguanine synthase [Cupriavidus taiwanensis]
MFSDLRGELTYPVNEVFESLQGEASWTGTPSTFIRLQGCPVGCPWCDTKHTWTLDEALLIGVRDMLGKQSDAATYARLTVAELLDVALGKRARHVVITGGEPCRYDLEPLCEALLRHDLTVQIETSGTHAIKAPREVWVTVSPKYHMPGGYGVMREALLRANEIKMPVGKQADVELVQQLVEPVTVLHVRAPVIWLQPLSQNVKATALCVEAATRYGWRVSLQVHKFIGAR